MSNSPNNISLSSSPNFSFQMKKSRTMIFRKQMNKHPNGYNSNNTITTRNINTNHNTPQRNVSSSNYYYSKYIGLHLPLL